ncbi:GntR family transcriptional regulator [Herbiconiux sp. VKM Ac-2851]|uniref:GntR family transcriptional regulator n=1 Tax=Herbiconiux sp. VKM Ac-2851 TaxID=2739025 RepID=UPI0015674F62|nr:GntR family transcriptional regulator [Herbiconiux sp. VKM Ac-2851]NQX36415.1 GntR family transcriptional regulator [Herbiconiux sp. VKM Ac-2851]
MVTTIERDSAVPYYEQLFDILREQIAGGGFPDGARLPSELELCREYGLSRATVRQTFLKLETEGFARRVPRRGVFAAKPSESSGWIIQDSQGFLESQIQHGQGGIETEVLRARFTEPPEHVAQLLQTEPGDDAFELVRVRSLEGRPAMYSTNWFPRASGRVVSAAKDVLDGSGSVNQALRGAGFITAGARRVIHALRTPPEIATALGVGEDEPALRVGSLSWNQDAIRFDYYETWVLTDVVPLEVNVAAS